MQRSSSYSVEQTPPETSVHRKDSWISSSFGNAATGCCYSVGYHEDYDDFYQPVQKNYEPIEKEELIDAELGLIEDHFSRPEGYFGLSTIEELEMAIENCEELIKGTSEKIDKKKQLVRKLVQLRLKYQEAKESPETPPEMNVVLGHNFQLGSVEKLQQYCEKCCNIIWGVFHKWYRCKWLCKLCNCYNKMGSLSDCGFKCHSKCVNLITRICAYTKMQEHPSYILDICPEAGLSQQKYRCAECKRKFTFQDGECFPRLCDYNGMSYCSYCHWNSSAVIPARVIHNWDFTPRKVCRASIQFLRIMSKKPVFNVESQNPMLFGFVTELSTVKKLRQDILVMKQYFLTCHAASEEKLLLQLKDRQHFVESADTYSLRDLIDAQSGELLNYLQNVYSIFMRHITETCQGCRGKGFICELCKADEVLFPFYSQTDSCIKCNSLFHQDCFLTYEGFCPKCSRKAKQNSE